MVELETVLDGVPVSADVDEALLVPEGVSAGVPVCDVVSDGMAVRVSDAVAEAVVESEGVTLGV